MCLLHHIKYRGRPSTASSGDVNGVQLNKCVLFMPPADVTGALCLLKSEC